MSAYSTPAPRPGDIAGTLRLLVYLALAIAMIVLDHRGGWLAQIRARSEAAVQPLWWLAGAPGRVSDAMRDDASSRTQLSDENRVLRNALLISGARLARLQASAAENARLRGLLGAAQRGGLNVQLAPILNIDLDPTRQRLILDAGSRDGVQAGQSVIDAGGLLGQIIQVQANTATLLLITDPDHAVPVVVVRTGVRLIAYGKGRGDRLELANIPLSSDIKPGDSVVTSGMGGRFPAGFPVGTIIALHPDDSRSFLVGELKPAAQLDRGRDVLLLKAGPAPAAPEAMGEAAVAPPAAKATAGGKGFDQTAMKSREANGGKMLPLTLSSPPTQSIPSPDPTPPGRMQNPASRVPSSGSGVPTRP